MTGTAESNCLCECGLDRSFEPEDGSGEMKRRSVPADPHSASDCRVCYSSEMTGTSECSLCADWFACGRILTWHNPEEVEDELFSFC